MQFAEKRFSDDDGRGVMFTNGTGTGKTYSGLGVIKRFERQGKTNILIVAPSDKIVGDWISSAENLSLEIKQLASVHDAGTGIVATTYANFGDNDAIGKRDWDLIVTDEAHYLSSNAAGDSSLALERLRALTMHERARHTYAKHVYPNEYAALLQAREDMKLIRDDTMDQMVAALRDALKKAEATWKDVKDKADAKYAATAEKDKARVVMLSVDQGPGLAKARKLLAGTALEADSGYADGGALETLKIAMIELFRRADLAPVPLDLLLDAEGQLVLLYLRPVESDELAQDLEVVAKLDLKSMATPKLLGGRWLVRPRRDYRELSRLFAGLGTPKMAEPLRRVADERAKTDAGGR